MNALNTKLSQIWNYKYVIIQIAYVKYIYDTKF